METDRYNYIVFSILDSRFAIDALAVKESFLLPEITPLEETPPYIVGVINLHGRTIPVVDPEVLFGHIPQPYSSSDAVMVIAREDQMVGIVASEVHDVIQIRPEDIDPPLFPPDQRNPQRRFVTGEARVAEDIIMVLDCHALLDCAVEVVYPDEEDQAEKSESQDAIPETPRLSFRPDADPAEKRLFRRRALELMGRAIEENASAADQVAVVLLSGEYFSIPLHSVQEFSSITNLTPIPNCPEHIVGNMNLRGNILTIIDIRGLLEMPTSAFNEAAKIVVVSGADCVVALAVDDIHDITVLNSSDIVPLPASASPAVQSFAQGTACYDGRAMTILDIAVLLRKEELVVNDAI